MSRVPWLVLALVLLVPSAAAERWVDQVDVRLHPDHPFVVVDTRLTGKDATQARSTMDGNGDGQVDAQEADKFSAAQSWGGGKDLRCIGDFGLFTVADARPAGLASYEISYSGAAGPATGAAPITRTETFRYAMKDGAPGVATVRFGRLDLDNFGGRCDNDGVLLSIYFGPGTTDAKLSEGATFLLGPAPDATFDLRSATPSMVRPYWQLNGLQASTPEERSFFSDNWIRVPVGRAATESDGPITGLLAGATSWSLMGGLLALAGASFALASEAARFQAFKWLAAIGLYSRLSRDEVLEHSRRDELFQVLRVHPEGPSLADLRRLTGFAHGTIVHHLRMLEQKDIVLAVRDGFRTRFFLRGPRITPTPYLSEVQQKMLEATKAEPGLTQKVLATRLGLPREAVSYHARRLAEVGQLEIRQDGRWRRHFAREAMPTTVAGEAVPNAA